MADAFRPISSSGCSGRVELLWKDEGRYVDHKRYMFDRNWLRSRSTFIIIGGLRDPEPPESSVEMIGFRRDARPDFEFVDVDFYEVDGRVYFGEMTFSPAGGQGPLLPTPEQIYHTVCRFLAEAPNASHHL